MSCCNLDVGRLCSILWWRAENCVACVCGWCFMGVKRVCTIYGYFSWCFVKRVCWFPTEAVEVMWWLKLCVRGFVEVYRELLR